MAERPNAPALKAGDRKVRGFKSLSLRSPYSARMVTRWMRVVAAAALLTAACASGKSNKTAAPSTTARCSRETEPWCAAATGRKSAGRPPPAPACAMSCLAASTSCEYFLTKRL